MSDYMGDLSSYLSGISGNYNTTALSNDDKTSLSMTDFLTLMVTELTNQSIDQTADTSQMLNQMVQMQMITALTNLTDASIMSYAASLVGKEVTVGQYDSDGNLQELVGQVTGTGTMNGEQVVFVGDKYYYMNEIMAVGKLPEVKVEDPETDTETEGAPETEGGAETNNTPVYEGTSGAEIAAQNRAEAQQESETETGVEASAAVDSETVADEMEV